MTKEPLYPDQFMCKLAHECLIEKSKKYLKRNDRRAQLGVYCEKVISKTYHNDLQILDMIYSPQNFN